MDFVSKQGILFATLVESRQNDICRELEAIDNATFNVDLWKRPGGGGGNTRLLQSNTFEKAGVNSSRVYGHIDTGELTMFNQLIQKIDPSFSLSEKSQFFATGISLVIHPTNPFIPTVHANYRYFEIQHDDQLIWWMGGGADLTPYYLINEDVTHFHNTHCKICESYSAGSYDVFKAKCDDYFYLPHRQETRGVGGIFFDYLNDNFDLQFEFISNLSTGFINAYIPIVKKRLHHSYTDSHRKWQAIRRSRYAEFNLLYDRGTLFGLKTNGRIESILMSMPPMASWVYNYEPKKNSEEAKLQTVLKHPQQWVIN